MGRCLCDGCSQWLHPYCYVHLLLHLHAYQGQGNRRSHSYLVEAVLDHFAIDSICYHDESGNLPRCQRMRHSFHPNYCNICCLHFVSVFPLRTLLWSILHEAKEEESLSYSSVTNQP